jgi:hypothetical protein
MNLGDVNQEFFLVNGAVAVAIGGAAAASPLLAVFVAPIAALVWALEFV